MSENIKNKKTAIILFNLGGPDSKEAIKPFLFNLFNDKYIITLPAVFRYIIAWIISTKRKKIAEKIYSYTGNRSPILKETDLQQKALKKELKGKIELDFEIFICMRHWHPMSTEVAEKVKVYKPDEIILLPLYPQFSTTTTASSIENFKLALKKQFLDKIPLKIICCYFTDDGFIESHIKLIKKKLENIKNKDNYRILFSAHGLPKKIIESGDPYQWQVENTVKKIVSKLSIDNLDYKITYQSRVGPLKWIGPNTEDEIKIAGEKKSLIIVPIAFVSEHVETKVELDIEYKNIASVYDIDYLRVPTLGVEKHFIKFLSNLIINFSKREGNFTCSSNFKKICPSNFKKCPCKS